MLINEVSKLTRLTKKAIEYYTIQGLVSPSILESGYRNYNNQDIEKLNKISVLRKLDLSIDEIRNILKDTTNSALQEVSVKKELDYKRDMLKKDILAKLSQGASYDEINIELKSIEQSKTITDKLLASFPGYYGRFICMHFARFLSEPIKTEAQQSAFEEIVSFLDNLDTFDIPKDLEDYLNEGTKDIGTEQISEILESIKKSYDDPEKFLTDNKEFLMQYFEYKKSEEYKSSPASRLMELMKEFNSSNGYYDIFIPAMKQLSFSYAEYCHQSEIANKKLMEQYPEIKKLYDTENKD